MKRKLSRREFLRLLGLSAAALAGHQAITGCAPQPAPTSPPTTAPLTATPTQQSASNQPAATEAPKDGTAAPTSRPIPNLAVARGEDPEAMVRAALESLGGMQQFVSPGQSVLIKPNICNAYHSYEYASTTNPWVVGAVVKLCLEAGAAQVKVMDFPFAGEAKEAYRTSGIEEQVLQAGGKMEPIARFKFNPAAIPEGQSLSEVNAYDEVLNADVLINIPIAKHHNLAKLTLGMKNLMGCIQNRPNIHFDMGQRLSDLLSLFQPDLTIIDALRILVDHGPTGGNLDDVRLTNTLIASRDVVAADSYAASLFGMTPEDLDYVMAASDRGLGRRELNNLKIEEVQLDG